MTIASAKIEDLAQRLARSTGEDVEIAIERSLEERISRLTSTATKDRRAALMKFFECASNAPVKASRPIDDIIGDGPDGLPAR